MGRLVAFVARQHADGAVARVPPAALGIGVDEEAAVVIDRAKIGRLVRRTSSARAFVVRGGPPAAAVAGQPLTYAGLRVYRLDDTTSTFDFGAWCGTARSYALSVDDGAFTSGLRYDASATASACP